MKKVLCVMLALIMSLFVCACSAGALSSDSSPSDDKKDSDALPSDSNPSDDKKDPNETILEEAVYFNQHLLNCSEGYPIVFTYLPDGWNTEVTMNYRISAEFPLQAVAELKSPDGKYGVIYFSPMSFKDRTKILDGERTADDGSHEMLKYATYYHYRNAYDTSDLILSTMGYRWTDRDSYTVDSNVVNEYSSGVQNKAAQSVQRDKNYLDSYGMQYKSLQLMKSEGTIDRSRGWLTDGTKSFYAETTTYVGMSDVRFEAMDLMLGNQLYGTYGEETIDWQYDGFSVYWAVDEQTFHDNYDVAQFIISNTGTTQAFAAAQEQILSIIIPQVINGVIEVSDYGASIVQDVMNNWNDTNDRVAQNWDDYILDQDRCSTLDGNKITVPTKADYVYYNNTNGSVIWTDSALIEPEPEYQQIK